MKLLIERNCGEEEELHYNSKVTRIIGIWKMYPDWNQNPLSLFGGESLLMLDCAVGMEAVGTNEILIATWFAHVDLLKWLWSPVLVCWDCMKKNLSLFITAHA